MIGIIPGKSKSYEVIDMIKDGIEYKEGSLYVDPKDKRIYVYSKSMTRSTPEYGFFPVWNGTDKIVTRFSNTKTLDQDVIISDISIMASSIDKAVAERVTYNHRRCNNDELLRPDLVDGDNMFTQCIKGVINNSEWTLIDILDMTRPRMEEKTLLNFYSALTRITFMRLEKWNVWIDQILHLRYKLEVRRKDSLLITYKHPESTIDVIDKKYNTSIPRLDDPYKRIIKIIMQMENLSKSDLKSPEVDDYTINNMMTTINGTKSLSSQLFSRFIRMAGLSYNMTIYDTNMKEIFVYSE